MNTNIATPFVDFFRMDDDSLRRALTEAQGFLDLGMPAEAWEALETVPFFDSRQQCPDVIALRLVACAALKKWETGSSIVSLITPAHHIDFRDAAVDIISRWLSISAR